MIKKITGYQCLKFLTSHQAEREHISLNGIVDDRVQCYGFYLDGKLVSVASILSFTKKKRIKAFYTDKQHRGDGSGLELIKGILEKDIQYSVFATPYEVEIFKHLGFEDKTKNPDSLIRYMEGKL